MPINDVNNEIPQIIIAPIQQLTVYQVSEGELDTIEKGTIDTLFLNLSISLLSLFIGILFPLVITPMQLYHFIIFTILDSLFALSGIILLLVWYKRKEVSRNVFVRIRSRVRRPPGIQQSLE